MKRRAIKKKLPNKNLAVEKERAAFRVEFPYCWVCGGFASDIHEMACGPARRQAYKDRRLWMRLCRTCHVPWVQHWPVAKQLAYKAWFDPAHYDRVVVNNLRGRADNAIDTKEVAYWSRLLQFRQPRRSKGDHQGDG